MRQSRARFAALWLCTGLVLLAAPKPLAGQIQSSAEGEVTNIFLPAPRGLRQQLTKARKALEEQDFSGAVDLLGQLLAAGEPAADRIENAGEQDYFLSGSDQPGTQVSLKTEAQRLLGGMSEKGRALYELKFGADARQLLDHALESRDLPQLVEVTRRYFHTDAGYEATMLIGRHYLDQGRPLAAALRFQRLEGSANAVLQYDPELSVLLATCWVLADMPERARQTLLGLEARAPNAKWRFGDREVALFDPADKTLAESVLAVTAEGAAAPQGIDRVLVWLQCVIGPEIAGQSSEATQWTMFRGDAARNAESAGGTPLLSARWRVQTANHPTDEEMIRQGRKQYREQGVPLIPTLNPLAVADVIVMRSPRRLIGVDFATGKRIWEFPWFQAPDEEVLENDRILPQQQLQHPHVMELSRRIWDDAPYGQASSDGAQIFILWGLGATSNQPSVLVQRFGIQRPNEADAADSNKLVALDLKAQGKLRWIVGDEDGTDEPRLAGAFFLGAPLPLMGQLFVLAEINGEIRLVVLDANSGRLEWFQQLAHVDARNINTDPGRRAAGATPSFSDGVMVCPTSSGAVVAVDVASRSLLWGYQYPLTGPKTRISMSSYRYPPKPLGERWADATVTLSDGRVLVTPVESDQLYCLDLLTGEPVWDPIDRGDMLYTACVFKGHAIMVGKQALQAISLQDGKTQWTCPLESGLPSGRGLMTAGYYYLPTSTNRLLKINLTDGEIVEDIETDSTLGNLVAYKDQVVSLNVDCLAAYYQTAPLRTVVAERLEANADDGWALARQAELLLHDGKHGEALKVFQLAYQLNPEDDAIRSSLVRSLLSALRDNFDANQRFSIDLEKLISEPEELATFCRWMAVGLKGRGDYEKATEYFLRLASMESTGEFGSVSNGSDMVRLDGHLQVHRRRWLSVQIQQTLSDANGAASESINNMIRAHMAEIVQSQSISKLKQFVEHFDSHPAGTEARMQLAQLLLERGHLLHAELELIELQRSAAPPLAAKATALLAQMLIDNAKLEEAAVCVEHLSKEWGDVVTSDGQTGRELAAAMMANAKLRTWIEQPSRWLYGECETTRQDQRPLSSYVRISPIQLDEIRGPFPRYHTVVYRQNENSLVLSDAQGKTRQQVLLGDQNRFISTSSVAGNASANGHLLVMNVGFEVMAIDTLRGASQQGDVVLWRNDLSSNLTMSTNRTRQIMAKTITRQWGPARVVPSDTARSLVGLAGPVTRLGVVYQKMQELTCADPLTGEAMWVRGGVEPGSDIFGDEEFTFVVGPESSEALVLSTADGTEVGRRDVTSRQERWITFGRHVLTCRSDGKQLTVRCFDAWKQQDVWRRALDDDAQCWRPSRDEVAMFDPEGKLLILNLTRGDVVVDCQLQPDPTLERLYVLASPDSYTVVVSGKKPDSGTTVRSYGSIGGELCPEINGRVYSIDRQTAKPRWPVAAEVYEYYLPLDQAPDSPTLVFLQNTRAQPTPSSPRTEYKAAILVLDKRDGRQLYAADGLERILNYAVESDPESQTVAISTNVHQILLKFSDKPVAAPHPFQMKLEASTSTKVLQNVGKIAGAVLEAISEKSKQEGAKDVLPPAQKEGAQKEGAQKQEAPQAAAQEPAKPVKKE